MEWFLVTVTFPAALTPSDVPLEVECPCGSTEYGRPTVGGNAAGCRGSGSARTLRAFKPSNRLVIGPAAEAFKASNVALAALHSCGF